ncbi:hypothetical protein Golob_018709, partial [Gossypium lobatum]|nr:hypothetical protein [Gossypium lobatum]
MRIMEELWCIRSQDFSMSSNLTLLRPLILTVHQL